MQVSIIIPVYNAERYLKRCLESVLEQTYTDLEIILVNDGSSDASPSICDGYKNKDHRIQVIHSKNSGQSVARNMGIQQAKGAYISFVDADDVLVKDGIERLINIASKGSYDIVCGSYYRVDKEIKPSRNASQSGALDRYGNREQLRRYHQFKTTSGFGYVWGKLYKRSFLNEHGISFDGAKKVFMEDTLFNLKLYAYSPNYYLLNEPIYYYYIYHASTSNKNEDITDRALFMLKDYDAFLNNIDRYEENIDLLIPLLMRVLSWSIIKAIYSKGWSFRAIHKTIRAFSDNEDINQLFYHNRAYSVLFKLPSLLEQLFYSLCLTLFRMKCYSGVSIIFFLTYPMAQRYINRNVKN